MEGYIQIMKEKIYKLFLIFMVSLSLGAGPAAQNEIAKMLEVLSETSDRQGLKMEEEETEPDCLI